MAATSGPKLLDRVRESIRLRHYSPRTETAYVYVAVMMKRVPARRRLTKELNRRVVSGAEHSSFPRSRSNG
jgi:hypothetical protein